MVLLRQRKWKQNFMQLNLRHRKGCDRLATAIWRKYCLCNRPRVYLIENTRRILRSLYVARTWPVRVPVMAVSTHTSSWPRTTAYVPSTGEKRCACTTFRHGLLTGIRGLYGLKKPVELRAGPCGPVRYAVRSPTGHWNFGPYGARKLPGSSMWPRHKQRTSPWYITILWFNQG